MSLEEWNALDPAAKINYCSSIHCAKRWNATAQMVETEQKERAKRAENYWANFGKTSASTEPTLTSLI